MNTSTEIITGTEIVITEEKRVELNNIWKSRLSAFDMIDEVFDPAYRSLKKLNISLYDNQIQIMEAVLDWNIPYLVVVSARGSGKTFSVAAGTVLLCRDNPGLVVAVFAPKESQATRILEEMITIIKKSNINSEINWKTTTKSRLNFMNGSYVICQSAGETVQGEGIHANILIIDESSRVSDYVMANRILPMTGSFLKNKIIKIGVPLYRNHFYQSFKSSQYKKVIFDWTQCPILLTGGSVTVEGVKLSKYVLDRMPKHLKMKIFPTHPELHYDGDMTETDFKTQYMVEWVESLNILLNAEDQKKLSAGTHDWLNTGYPNEDYYFGLDFASGTLMPGKSNTDFHSLSIIRKNPDNSKNKVFHAEWRDVDPLDVMEEIENIIDPVSGRFKCKFGLIDYSVVGVVGTSYYQKKKVPCEGIMYGATEPMTKKNWKNALIEQALGEIKALRFTYPKKEQRDSIVMLHKSFDEWCSIEKETTLGINNKYEAPSGSKDDCVFSDAMAVFAADKASEFKTGKTSSYKIPMPLIGGTIQGTMSGIRAPGNSLAERIRGRG